MALIKTVNGLALASMKTRNGLAAASVKTINGLDAVVSGGTTYWGVTDASAYTSFEILGGYWVYNNNAVWAYTCPSDGVVQSIEVWCKSNGGTAGVMRVAIYNTSLGLIGQGNSAVTVSSTTVGWVGHVGTANLKPVGGSAGDPINLSASTNYVLAISCSLDDTKVAYVAGANGSKYNNNNYTGGFPDPIASGSLLGEKFAVRIGIQ